MSLVIYLINASLFIFIYRINFWIHSVIIKLLPCFILTIISFVLIDVLCRANKRKLKLKGYSAPQAASAATVTNGQRWERSFWIFNISSRWKISTIFYDFFQLSTPPPSLRSKLFRKILNSVKVCPDTSNYLSDCRIQ